MASRRDDNHRPPRPDQSAPTQRTTASASNPRRHQRRHRHQRRSIAPIDSALNRAADRAQVSARRIAPEKNSSRKSLDLIVYNPAATMDSDTLESISSTPTAAAKTPLSPKPDFADILTSG